MPKKNSKKKKKEFKGLDDEEIIIGYNSRRKKDKPPKKKRKEKKKKQKLKRILLGILKLILILAALVGIGVFLFISPVFNITDIQVENASKISANTYVVLSDIQIGENIFRISKQRSISAITKESYVEEVKVTRQLPGTIILSVTERTPKYMIEVSGGRYMYIDKNGYALEINATPLELPILKGTVTDVEKLNMGDRILEEDLQKFNDLIKIIDGVNNNNIEVGLTSVDISNHNNYILEFEAEKKEVILGDTTDLSTKMIWIKYFMEENKGKAGTIHLNTENIYFAPEE